VASKAGVQLVRCADDGWPLVRIISDTTAPEIVSSARIEMTANVLMARSWRPIVAENVRAWRIFKDDAGNNRGADVGDMSRVRDSADDKANPVTPR
jgi:hypothetical protein